MSYDEDGLLDEEQGFKMSEEDDDLDESMEPMEEPGDLDFEDEDPDSRYH